MQIWFSVIHKKLSKRLPRAEYWYVTQCRSGIKSFKNMKEKKSLWWRKAADGLRVLSEEKLTQHDHLFIYFDIQSPKKPPVYVYKNVHMK